MYRIVVALLAWCAACAGAVALQSPSPLAEIASHQQSAQVVLRHAPSGFAVRAPRGFKLRVAAGGYRVSGGRIDVSVRLVRTTRAARIVGRGLERPGDRLLVRSGNAQRFRQVAEGGGQRRAVSVRRRGAVLVIAIATTRRGDARAARSADRIVSSISGGTPGARPTAPPQRLVPLVRFRATDGGATAWVPADGDWVISSSQGTLEGSSHRGNFLLGQSFNVIYPEAAPLGLPSTAVVHPYVDAAVALEQVWPLINRGAGVDMTDVRVRSVLGDATLPSFRSSAMLLFDYRIGGRQYVGVANIATEDRLSAAGTFFWQVYISVIAVPVGGDPQVGAALRLVWRSWNPSGAIAARSQASQRLLEETNQMWRGVAEFRSRTADQQSRDVSCLLGTGPFIDDNARQLGLPPLRDCESVFVRVRS